MRAQASVLWAGTSRPGCPEPQRPLTLGHSLSQRLHTPLHLPTHCVSWWDRCFPSDLKTITTALARGGMHVKAQFLPTRPLLPCSQAPPLWGDSPQHRCFWGSTEGPQEAQGPLSTFVRPVVIAADFLHHDFQSDLPTSLELGLAYVVQE